MKNLILLLVVVLSACGTSKIPRYKTYTDNVHGYARGIMKIVSDQHVSLTFALIDQMDDGDIIADQYGLLPEREGDSLWSFTVAHRKTGVVISGIVDSGKLVRYRTAPSTATEVLKKKDKELDFPVSKRLIIRGILKVCNPDGTLQYGILFDEGVTNLGCKKCPSRQNPEYVGFTTEGTVDAVWTRLQEDGPYMTRVEILPGGEIASL